MKTRKTGESVIPGISGIPENPDSGCERSRGVKPPRLRVFAVSADHRGPPVIRDP